MSVRRAFLLLLLVQAALLVTRIDFLSVWMDERFTLETAGQPIPELLRTVAHDIHPPLYFVIVHYLGTDIVRARLFSAAAALASTTLLYFLWWRKLRGPGAVILMAAWTLSPAVLLYGRMARSYTLQVLLAICAVFAIREFRKHPDRIRAAVAAISLLLLCYTHYAPGVALLIAANVWLLIQRKRPPVFNLVLFDAIVAIGYAPWIYVLSAAAAKWRDQSNIGASYSLTGSAIKETIVKLGYGLTSFAIGETFPFWIFPLTLVFLYGLWQLARRAPRVHSIFWLILPAAVIGYLGVARWVSYAFVPARLLWLLPFAQLAWIFPFRKTPRLMPAFALTATVLICAVSTWSYFHREDFRNKAYALPLEEIAAEINRDGGRLLIDPLNTSPAINAYLTPGVKSSMLDATAPPQIEGPVWIFRSTHDISPNQGQTETERRLCAGHIQDRQYFLPYSRAERALMQFAGVSGPLAFAFQLTHCAPATQ